ncbi:MAG: hydrolase [Paenibacillaceae bacterium]|jgi:inner membrane protein|nr:hydrolase [Paenibacillaceae bacterium]
MDTASHLLFGATLGGLAYLHPEVAAQPGLAQAMLLCTVVGSHAPDFDTVARLKSYRHYLRYHRGITHSLPALGVWPALIALPFSWAFGVLESFWLLYMWTLAAVGLHVFLDWLNVYGVQCFRPLNRRWHHLDILPLFDPFLFALHAIGLVGWLAADWRAVHVFPAVYAASCGYVLLRMLYQKRLLRRIRSEYAAAETGIQLVPGLIWGWGQFLLETEQEYRTGSLLGGRAVLQSAYAKESGHPAAQATLGGDSVRTFLSFAEKVHVSITEGQDGFLVQWRDVRFWHNSKLPFGVDVKLDTDLKIMRENLCWSKKVWDPPYV